MQVYPIDEDPDVLSDDALAVRLDLWSWRLNQWRGFAREADDPRADPHGDRLALLLAGVQVAERNVWRLQAELCRRGLPECPSK